MRRRRRTAPCSASSASPARSSSSRPATASTTAARWPLWPRSGRKRARWSSLPPDVAPAELQSLHDLGARGVRYMMLPGGVLPWSGLERTAAAIAPLGWHIDLQLDGRELPLHEAMLASLALPPGDRPRRPIHGPGRARQRTAARALPAARQRQVLDQDLGAVRKLAQRAAGVRRHRLDRAPGRAPLSRAVPVGEQLAAPEPEPGAIERRDARLGPRLLRRSGGAEEGARRQPGRAVRLRAGRPPRKLRAAFSPRMDYPGNLFAVAAPSGAGKSSLVKALLELDSHLSSRSRTRRESRAARSRTAASTTSSTSRRFAP